MCSVLAGEAAALRSLVSYMPASSLCFLVVSHASYSHTASLNGYAYAKDTPPSRAAILPLAPLKSAKHKLNSITRAQSSSSPSRGGILPLDSLKSASNMPPKKPAAKSPAKPRAKSPARAAKKPAAKSPAKPAAKSPAKPRAKSPAKPRAKSPAPKPRINNTADDHHARAMADDLAAIRAAYAKEQGLPPPKSYQIWTLLNVLAWIGWSAVLASAAYNEKLVLILELMCCAEVLRMIKGELKGNVKMGLVLHATRLIVYHQVLPFAYTRVILQAWSATELARYPYYVVPNAYTLAMRSFVPLVTFPLGVAAETMSLWGRLQAADSLLVKGVCALPLVNVVLAPIGYRSLLKKAVRAYDGLTKED